MVGRGLRPADGKTDCIVLDHSGAVYRHGLPEDEVIWTLDPDLKADAPAHTKDGSNFESSKRLVECSQCAAIRKGGEPCPNCGFLSKRAAQPFTCIEGDLGKVENGKADAVVYDESTKHHWNAQLEAIRIQRNRQPGWRYHSFLAKFGHEPPRFYTPAPMEPTQEVLGWVKHRDIAYAKGQAKARAQQTKIHFQKGIN
jgi:hypothetical protein